MLYKGPVSRFTDGGVCTGHPFRRLGTNGFTGANACFYTVYSIAVFERRNIKIDNGRAATLRQRVPEVSRLIFS